MSGRRIPVDLGPMTLHVPDAGGSCASLPSACVNDVLRLRAVMRRGADSPQGFARAPGVAEDDGHQADWAATGAASDIAVMVGCDRASLDDAPIEQLAFALSAALQSCPGAQGSACSAVRLALRPLVLRDAELGIEDSAGQLVFSLWVGDADDGQWLVWQLPRLTATLGERLNRPLRVCVFDGHCTSRLLAEQSRPAERAA